MRKHTGPRRRKDHVVDLKHLKVQMEGPIGIVKTPGLSRLAVSGTTRQSDSTMYHNLAAINIRVSN